MTIPATTQTLIREVLARAANFDDKPHQLWNGLRLLAIHVGDRETAEEMDRRYTSPQPGPISDSASGGASDSGGVDLSGVKVGDWGMTRNGWRAKCINANVSVTSLLGHATPVEWKLPTGDYLLTGRDGCLVKGQVCQYDIIRLLPENGGGT